MSELPTWARRDRAAWAPWYIADADDKKRARLNIISHLLSQAPPLHRLDRRDITLPKRQSPRGYVRPGPATAAHPNTVSSRNPQPARQTPAAKEGLVGIWWESMGSPSGPRSFNPVRIADLEYRMWVAYYLRRWTHVLAAMVRLLWLGFGTDWLRVLRGARLMLRAAQLWAPYPDNDPDGALAYLRELYALVRLRFGEPADPAVAASLEIDWWRAHRERQYAPDPAKAGDELVEALTRLYCYLFGETEAAVRPTAMYRVQAMDLSDQWVRAGCRSDSPLLPQARAALISAYTALLAAVQRGNAGDA